jgi:hypothetical protein
MERGICTNLNIYQIPSTPNETFLSKFLSRTREYLLLKAVKAMAPFLRKGKKKGKASQHWKGVHTHPHCQAHTFSLREGHQSQTSCKKTRHLALMMRVTAKTAS